MPRKKTAEKKINQGDIARLFTDSFEILSNQILTSIMERNPDYDLSNSQLQEIQKMIQESKTSVNNAAISRLIKYF